MSYFRRYSEGTLVCVFTFSVPVFSGTERQNSANFKRKLYLVAVRFWAGTAEIFKKYFFLGGILCPYEKKISSFLVPVPG